MRYACSEVDGWLQAVISESLQEICVFIESESESWGILLVGNIFHTWCYLGGISSIRQIFGHKSLQFVNMHG
ncbi:MAG: hypothetical protein JSV77_03285 [Dehalococcoidales bacterium]|nr:MAG: hypothetical protein JSV77_03285 [Dehalococcoidales bacterium]